METAGVLTIVGGHVQEELLLRNEYLAAENEIMKSKFDKRLQLVSVRFDFGWIFDDSGKHAMIAGRKEILNCLTLPVSKIVWSRE